MKNPNWYKGMQSAGILNCEAPDIKDLTIARQVTGTWCSSFHCVGGNPRNKRGKLISEMAINRCPNCGSNNYLFHGPLKNHG